MEVPETVRVIPLRQKEGTPNPNDDSEERQRRRADLKARFHGIDLFQVNSQ